MAYPCSLTVEVHRSHFSAHRPVLESAEIDVGHVMGTGGSVDYSTWDTSGFSSLNHERQQKFGDIKCAWNSNVSKIRKTF